MSTQSEPSNSVAPVKASRAERYWALWPRIDPLMSRFFISSAVVSAVTAFVMAVTLGRDLAIAYRFGTGDAVDAFLIALLVPNLVIQTVGGALGTAVVPRILSLESNDPVAAERLIQQVATATVLMLTLLWLALAVTADLAVAVLGAGFSAPKTLLTHTFYLWLLPSMVLQGWSTVVGAIVNARNRFAAIAVAPALRPAVMILLLLIPDRPAPIVLVWGLLAGSILEAALVTRSALNVGIPLGLKWPDKKIVKALEGFGATSAGSIVVAVAALLNQYLASLMASGSVAALSYGGKVTQLVIALCALPVGVTALPLFSALTAERRWTAFSQTLRQGAATLLVIGIPVALFCSLFSRPIVTLLFQRGAFSSAEVVLVAQVQSYLVWQLPFYLLAILWVRALAAMQRNGAIFVVACVNAATNLALSLYLMNGLGVVALAIGTTLGQMAGSLVAGYLVLSTISARKRSISIQKNP